MGPRPRWIERGSPQGAPLPKYARAAYQDFLTPWKDADPDIPIVALYLNTTFSGQTRIYCPKIRHNGEVLYVKLLQNNRL
jgi:hypothetical protein